MSGGGEKKNERAVSFSQLRGIDFSIKLFFGEEGREQERVPKEGKRAVRGETQYPFGERLEESSGKEMGSKKKSEK